MDLRGHGHSDNGAWSWPAAVADVEAVAANFKMSAPAAMGHSLGGMVASMWGREHPEAAGVINLDGHGNPRPDQYIGLDPAWVAEKRAELDALQRQQLSGLSGPLSDGKLAVLEAQQRSLATQLGAPEALFIECLRRGLEVRGDGTYLRPAPDGLGAEIYASLHDVNMLDVYREIWIGELTAAFRRGQTQDLEALATSQDNVSSGTVEGTHGLLFERAEAITTTTLEYLGLRSRASTSRQGTRPIL